MENRHRTEQSYSKADKVRHLMSVCGVALYGREGKWGGSLQKAEAGYPSALCWCELFLQPKQ